MTNKLARALLVSVTLTSTIGILASSSVFAADQLENFHAQCAPHGTGLLSSEIPCMKTLLEKSSDPIYNESDAATQLFVLSSDKLLHRLHIHQITEDSARVKYLQMLLVLQDHHRADVAAIEAREQAAANQQEIMDTEQRREQDEDRAEAQRKEEEIRQANELAQQQAAINEQRQQQIAAQRRAQATQDFIDGMRSIQLVPPSRTNCLTYGGYGMAQTNCTTTH